MSERTLVPIFFFWALLTIITPTLILLSENSKADLDLNGNVTEGMKARRMIGYTQNHIIKTPPSPAKSVVAEEELASAPAPVPVPVPVPVPTPSPGTSTPTRSHSLHNHTLTSNRTNDGLTLSSPKIHVQVKQTNIK